MFAPTLRESHQAPRPPSDQRQKSGTRRFAAAQSIAAFTGRTDSAKQKLPSLLSDRCGLAPSAGDMALLPPGLRQTAVQEELCPATELSRSFPCTEPSGECGDLEGRSLWFLSDYVGSEGYEWLRRSGLSPRAHSSDRVKERADRSIASTWLSGRAVARGSFVCILGQVLAVAVLSLCVSRQGVRETVKNTKYPERERERWYRERESYTDISHTRTSIYIYIYIYI